MFQEKNGKKFEEKLVSAFEPKVLSLGIILAFFSAVICMQMIAKVGSTPNTSLIGAIFAMVVSRIPWGSMKQFRSLDRQNLIQTIVSGAGFSAANCGFICVTMMLILGEPSYIIAMGVGSLIGSIISVISVGKIFDSVVFPAKGAWPPGVATASTIQAGDSGGDKGKRLLQGLFVGVIGSIFNIPVAGIGVAFLADFVAMTALGLGLILRGYSEVFFNGFSIGSSSIPQGVMIGAGLIALLQSLYKILKKSDDTENSSTTVTNKKMGMSIFQSLLMHTVGAVLLALFTGLITDLPLNKMLIWIIWVSFSATVAMLLVGMAAMNSGWFPGFAITTIFLTGGLFLGFPPIALALMTGYITSVGPCFADMGYDLKAGWILRGEGRNKSLEIYGRKQQVIIEGIGVVIGIVTAFIFGKILFEQGLYPPISKVFATTINAGSNESLMRELMIWAIPGAIIQLIFGLKMAGVLFATGLLINSPMYGIGLLLALIVRKIIGTEFMDIRAPGLIAGDGIYGFFNSIFRALF